MPTVPTDPQFPNQWHLTAIGNITRIWDEYRGGGVRDPAHAGRPRDDGARRGDAVGAARFTGGLIHTTLGVALPAWSKRGGDRGTQRTATIWISLDSWARVVGPSRVDGDRDSARPRMGSPPCVNILLFASRSGAPGGLCARFAPCVP